MSLILTHQLFMTLKNKKSDGQKLRNHSVNLSHLLRLITATVLHKLLIIHIIGNKFLLKAKSQENKKIFVTFLNLSEICMLYSTLTLIIRNLK